MVTEQQRASIADVFEQWLALYEEGLPIEFTPAREYASDAIRDCRDLVLGILDGDKRLTTAGNDAADGRDQ